MVSLAKREYQTDGSCGSFSVYTTVPVGICPIDCKVMRLGAGVTENRPVVIFWLVSVSRTGSVCCPRSFSSIREKRVETPLVQRPPALAVGTPCMMQLTRILMFPFFLSRCARYRGSNIMELKVVQGWLTVIQTAPIVAVRCPRRG